MVFVFCDLWGTLACDWVIRSVGTQSATCKHNALIVELHSKPQLIDQHVNQRIPFRERPDRDICDVACIYRVRVGCGGECPTVEPAQTIDDVCKTAP